MLYWPEANIKLTTETALWELRRRINVVLVHVQGKSTKEETEHYPCTIYRASVLFEILLYSFV